ncbi:hypothetical protein Trydic_g5857 [Trypoxylus dichotomus]
MRGDQAEDRKEEDFTIICAVVKRSYTRINGQLKDKYLKKLKSLIRQKESNSVDSRKTVINLSNIVLAVEMAAEKIQPPEAADEYRCEVRTAIEEVKPKQKYQQGRSTQPQGVNEREEYQYLAGGQRKR